MFHCVSVTSHCCFGVLPPADVAVSKENEVWTVWAVKLEGFLLLLQAEVVAWLSCAWCCIAWVRVRETWTLLIIGLESVTNLIASGEEFDDFGWELSCNVLSC